MRLRLRALLLAGVLLAAPAQAQSLGPPKVDGVWAQTGSDLRAEPDVRFGQLANGMRYALVRNATPAKQVSLRLRIGSGSLEERDDQQGLAHFLEHMAFKGSTHVPTGELLHILQRLGLQFGADTNASTGFDQTVFMFDLPEDDPKTLDTGLMLMREIGGELTLAQSAMDSERGVVLSEERLRDSPEYQAQKAQIAQLLQGQRAPERWPIGLTSVLQTAPVSLIRQFYEAWYRPDNATLIAVGDFDPDSMEAAIKARFSDWKAQAPASPQPDLGQVERRGEAVSLFAREGAPQQLSLSWVGPYDPTADTAARERRDTIEALGLAVLNRRLDHLAQEKDPPFTSAGASRDNVLRSARATILQVSPTPGGWEKGLAAAVAEQARLVRYGVSPAELQREIVDKRTEMTALAQQQATRRTPDLANQIAESVNDDEVFTSPEQNLANFDRYVAGLTPAQVDAALRAAFAGSGPLLAISTPQPIAGGEGAARAALDRALAQPVSPPVEQAMKAWPYASFGPAGRVVEARETADLGFTQVRFANGVRLVVKPTAFTKDQVLVSVRVGHGLLALPKGRASPVWLARALTLGGTRELTSDEIDRVLNDRVVSASFSIGDDADALTGATRPQDLAVELQLLAAYVSRPGFRPQAESRIKAVVADLLPQLESTPEGVLSRDLGPLTHDGDLRFQRLPTTAELAASRPGDLAALVGPALADGPLSITIVGDVTPDAAIAATAATFGAIPARAAPAPRPAADLDVRFPAADAAPVVLPHRGRPDQAVAYIAWPIQGFYADPRQARVAQVAAQVFENRLVEQVRMAEGATYSPGAQALPSQVFPRYGYLQAEVETPPAKIAGFYADVAKITADMRDRPPTDDELARAKAPALETLAKARQTNAWWLGVLSKAQDEPRQLDAIRTQEAQVRAVSPADVQRVAREDLKDASAWRLIVRSPTPAPGAPDQKPIGARPRARPPSPTPSSPMTNTGAPRPAVVPPPPTAVSPPVAR